MDNKKLNQKSRLVLVLISAVLLLGSSLVYAAERCQMIVIEEGQGAEGARLRITPEKVTIPVGTCTVWINWVSDRRVRVCFRGNAEQCIKSSTSSTGFEEKQLKPGESCYITEPLQVGKTASLYWTKPGVFKYTLEARGSETGNGWFGDIMAQGVIEVK